MAASARFIWACFLAEMLGTFLLVLIGDGVVASYVLTKREVDMFTACFAFGVGAMIATFTSAKISGAHINPAASLAFALDGKLQWRLVPVYICAQYLGGFLAALVLFVNYAEAIGSLDGGQRSAYGSANSTGHIFATYPGPWLSVWASLLDQTIGTGVLLFSICAVTDRSNNAPNERQQPFIVALVIGLVCLAFQPNCGAIFNPARDLAPRLLTSLFGYPSVWAPTQGLYWLTAGVLGPHVGAILGVFAYRLLIGRSLGHKRAHELAGLDALAAGGGGGEAKQQQRLHQAELRLEPQAKLGPGAHHHRHQLAGHYSSPAMSEANYGSGLR